MDDKELEELLKDLESYRADRKQSLSLLLDMIKTNIHAATEVKGHDLEVRKPNYPVEVLRQLLWNAILHRSYEATNAPVRLYWFDDQIEIHSPGGPFGQVPPENFGRPGLTDYRNPQIAEVMHTLGFIQKFGIGIELARSELKKNGNPPPELQAESAFVLALARKRT